MVEAKSQGVGKGLFTTQVKARGRTYFFDVQEAKAGGRYLVISESRRTDAGRQRSRLVVFPDHVVQFEEALHKAAAALQADRPQRAAKPS